MKKSLVLFLVLPALLVLVPESALAGGPVPTAVGNVGVVNAPVKRGGTAVLTAQLVYKDIYGRIRPIVATRLDFTVEVAPNVWVPVAFGITNLQGVAVTRWIVPGNFPLGGHRIRSAFSGKLGLQPSYGIGLPFLITR